MLNLHILCEHYYYNYYVSLYSFMFEDGWKKLEREETENTWYEDRLKTFII